MNASSSKSSKELGANSRTEAKSNDGSISCHKGEAEIHNVIEDSSEKVRETTSLQEPAVLIGDFYDNFWDPYSCAPNLMEFLDQSLDLFWDAM